MTRARALVRGRDRQAKRRRLHDLRKRETCYQYCFISGCRSENDPETNLRLHYELKEKLLELDPELLIEAIGITRSWGREATWLVIGTPEQKCLEVARRYKQDAIITASGLVFTDGGCQRVVGFRDESFSCTSDLLDLVLDDLPLRPGDKGATVIRNGDGYLALVFEFEEGEAVAAAVGSTRGDNAAVLPPVGIPYHLLQGTERFMQ